MHTDIDHRRRAEALLEGMKSNHGCADGLPSAIPPCNKDIRCLHGVIPDATSHNLGWVGLEAVRYRDLATNEIHMPALAEHLAVLHTKPPADGCLGLRKRNTRHSVGV